MDQEIQFKSDIVVRPIQKMGGDVMVVAAAKVSTSGEEAAAFADMSEANFGLINYLLKHRHGTPFEHSAMTFFVHAPIFVWREWHRHRIGFSYNEESGRYKELRPVFWIPPRNRKLIPVPGYKPARPEFMPCDSDDMYNVVVDTLQESYLQSYQAYQKNLERGIAREVARACLPVGIYSSCWVTTNPRALMHFLSLRTHEESFDPEAKSGAKFVSYPQAEIEQAARVAEQFLRDGWPLTYRAFCENGRVGP
jgi:thymidylate synthase (FAD)